MKEKEVQLKLLQTEGEAWCRAEQVAQLRDLKQYQRRIEADRRQSQLQDKVDIKSLSDVVIRQLATVAEGLSCLTPAPSITSSHLIIQRAPRS